VIEWENQGERQKEGREGMKLKDKYGRKAEEKTRRKYTERTFSYKIDPDYVTLGTKLLLCRPMLADEYRTTTKHV
jgi:hypothetical protein